MRRDACCRVRPRKRSGNSIRHAKPLAVWIELCAGGYPAAAVCFGPSPCCRHVCVRLPECRLPNAFGEYDETAEETAEILRDFAAVGTAQHRWRLLRQTTPPAYPADEREMKKFPRRPAFPNDRVEMQLAGFEPLTIDDDTLFVNVGERHECHRSLRSFAKVIRGG